MVAMTDHEMTKLCAQAMGYEIMREDPAIASVEVRVPWIGSNGAVAGHYHERFMPLDNDKQAMALVKRIGMSVYPWNDGWCAERNRVYGDDRDLNRAIVKCVAMQSLGDIKKAEKP